MNDKKLQSGFTLAEMLVVIAIIAIMAVAAYVIVKPAEDKGKIELTKSTIELLCGALEQYHNFYNRFPFYADKNYNQANLNTDVGSVSGSDHEPNYSSCEALYYFMGQLPDSQSIINSINSKLITNQGKQGGKLFITVNSIQYPLIRVVDAWGVTFRYENEKNENWNFPLITSAGPDKDFGDTDIRYKEDNITSKK